MGDENKDDTKDSCQQFADWICASGKQPIARETGPIAMTWASGPEAPRGAYYLAVGPELWMKTSGMTHFPLIRFFLRTLCGPVYVGFNTL